MVEDFSDTTVTVAPPTLEALPVWVPIRPPLMSYGHRQRQSTDFVEEIRITYDVFTVEESENDWGDLMQLQTVIFMPFIRLIAGSTEMPRVDSTGSGPYWAERLAIPLDVVRKEWTVTSDPSTGTVQPKLILEVATANT